MNAELIERMTQHVNALNEILEVAVNRKFTLLDEIRGVAAKRKELLRKIQLLTRYGGKLKAEDLDDLKALAVAAASEAADSDSKNRVLRPPVIEVDLTAAK